MTPPQTDARTASPTPDRVAAAVSETARQHGLAARMRPYAALTWDGSDGAVPGLYLDDLSGIPFLDEITAVEEYIHRARIRAGEGDLFAAVTAPAEGYETYCREHLGLGTTRWVDARHTSDPLAVARSCSEGAPYDTILAAAREAGALRLLPFMSVEPVWALAQQVHHDTGLPIQVVGPPPPVAWIANDKLALHELVTRVLDESWLAETRPCRTAPELATSLLALAEHAVQVGLKRTRCASAMGNAVFDAAALRAMGPDGVLSEVEAFLERTQWQGDEPVLAVVWEQTDLSPSTQLWIPPLGLGPPRLEGIYVQILEGPNRIFVGSRPSPLPAAVHRRLAEAATAVATALQAMGYAGRCSFDHLVVGDPADEPRLLFTECNGRWGGTSLPMSLVDRLRPSDRRPPYRAQDLVHEGLVGMTFPEVLERVGDELFDPRTGSGRYVFYNVGPLEPVGKIDVIAFGETQADAERAMTEELPPLLGL